MFGPAADVLRDRVVEQIDQWLFISSQKKRQYMDSLLETVVLEDMSHPAYRRFKELYEPLGLRTEERAQRYCRVSTADAATRESCCRCCHLLVSHMPVRLQRQHAI